MIPKKIHYCWLGGNEKPKSVLKCIESWKKYCPDYEINEWNESNLDLESAPQYIKDAYNAKKYGFVPDYFRLWIIYTYGGIYLDTDVQLISSFDSILGNKTFVGLEGDNSHVALGLGFGSEPGNELFLQHMHLYDTLKFINEDGSLNKIPSPVFTTELFTKMGFKPEYNEIQLVENITIYPRDYFSPKSYDTGEIIITPRTISIHHYDATWMDEDEIRHAKRARQKYKFDKIRYLPNKILIKIIGQSRYDKFKAKLKGKDK